MTDEQRPDETERPDEGDAKDAPPRWRLGGLSGRFRRRRADPESAEGQQAGDADEMPFLPPTPDRPSSARREADDDDLDEAEWADANDATSVADPHPDLHPALRRDLTDTPPAAEAIVEDSTSSSNDGADSVSPDTAETPEATSAADATAPEAPKTNTPVPGTPGFGTRPEVVEERIAITPRPPSTPLPMPPPAPPLPSLAPAPVGSWRADPGPEERTIAAEALADGGALEPVSSVREEADEPAPVLTRRSTSISAYLTVLTGVATLVIVAFLLIEPTPRWLLILGAGAVILGLDGTLRQTWREPFALGQETAPFLFVPALYMLSVPVLIEHNVTGEAVVLMGLGAGLGFGALAWAELASVRAFGAEYPQARTIVAANTYLAGFAIFSLTYVFNISLVPAMIATGIAAGMLAVEILREGEIDPMETLGLSLVTGVLVAEARWLFYYMPLDTYLAGLMLLLVFYLVTGLLHSYMVRALSSGVALQYGGITAAGMSLVVFARVTGLA